MFRLPFGIWKNIYKKYVYIQIKNGSLNIYLDSRLGVWKRLKIGPLFSLVYTERTENRERQAQLIIVFSVVREGLCM